jgi:hypothetical protein
LPVGCTAQSLRRHAESQNKFFISAGEQNRQTMMRAREPRVRVRVRVSVRGPNLN